MHGDSSFVFSTFSIFPPTASTKCRDGPILFAVRGDRGRPSRGVLLQPAAAQVAAVVAIGEADLVGVGTGKDAGQPAEAELGLLQLDIGYVAVAAECRLGHKELRLRVVALGERDD